MNKTLLLAAVLWTAMVLFFTWGFVRGMTNGGAAFDPVGFLIFVVGFWGVELGLLMATAHAAGRRGTIVLTPQRLTIETVGPFGRRVLAEP
jgi:hypothetical protein